MRVGKTRVMLDSIVVAFKDGHSAETIQQQFPALTLEEVYGAITFYLSHTDEVKEYLKHQEALWEKWRKETASSPNPVVERLRALRATDVSHDS
jgi:uncharacterized protein (DUF433 family)